MIPPPSEIYQVTRRVVAAFNAANVRYFLGGSVASALYGEARSTRDIDFVAAMLTRHVAPFLAALGDEFYAGGRAIWRSPPTQQPSPARPTYRAP